MPTRKWSFDNVNEALKDRNIIMITKEFKNVDSKCLFKSLKCGHEWSMRLSNVLSGAGCSVCSKKKSINSLVEYSKANGSPRKSSLESFKNKVYELYKDEYTVLGEYVNNRTPILMRHNNCGYEWSVLPSHFTGKNKSQCPKCQKEKAAHKHSETMKGHSAFNKKTNEQFLNDLKRIYGDEYIPLEEYVNNKTPIKILHTKCNKVFNITPDKLLNEMIGCQYCSPGMSYGEKYIQSILEENNIAYKPQYTFDDLRSDNDKNLRYDFGILDDDKLIGLIEYDGLQHFKSIDFYGGDEYYDKLMRYDKMKDDYCKTHNIPLLRIKYDEVEETKNKIVDFVISCANRAGDKSISARAQRLLHNAK